MTRKYRWVVCCVLGLFGLTMLNMTGCGSEPEVPETVKFNYKFFDLQVSEEDPVFEWPLEYPGKHIPPYFPLDIDEDMGEARYLMLYTFEDGSELEFYLHTKSDRTFYLREGEKTVQKFTFSQRSVERQDTKEETRKAFLAELSEAASVQILPYLRRKAVEAAMKKKKS